MWEEDLRALGIRATPQRRAVLGVLAEATGHLTPQEVYRRVQKRLPGVTEATIYRTLSFFVERGLVMSADWPGVGRVYELAPTHHHLVCRRCGEAVEVEDELLREIYLALEAATGFRIVHPHLTLQGLCPTCREEGTP